ncbi:hypothetical protein BB558_004983 [Smittium angustum]|uniref:VPS10 domain-containing protein n=1 Tax=Smittium angustum TaxID=133377 RepID=A0A2U1J1R5_SMIAN|nr:hypothetical protein BB558_004983 [Smittium angustum]
MINSPQNIEAETNNPEYLKIQYEDFLKNSFSGIEYVLNSIPELQKEINKTPILQENNPNLEAKNIESPKDEYQNLSNEKSSTSMDLNAVLEDKKLRLGQLLSETDEIYKKEISNNQLELLSQFTGIGYLEDLIQSLKEQTIETKIQAQKIQYQIRLPLDQMKSHLNQVSNLKKTLEIVRAITRIIQSIQRLVAQFPDRELQLFNNAKIFESEKKKLNTKHGYKPDKIQQALAMSAISITDIKELLSKKNLDKIHMISLLINQQVLPREKVIIQESTRLMENGFDNLRMLDVSFGLQVFYNLGIIGKKGSDWVNSLTNDINLQISEMIDTKSLIKRIGRGHQSGRHDSDFKNDKSISDSLWDSLRKISLSVSIGSQKISLMEKVLQGKKHVKNASSFYNILEDGDDHCNFESEISCYLNNKSVTDFWWESVSFEINKNLGYLKENQTLWQIFLQLYPRFCQLISSCLRPVFGSNSEIIVFDTIIPETVDIYCLNVWSKMELFLNKCISSQSLLQFKIKYIQQINVSGISQTLGSDSNLHYSHKHDSLINDSYLSNSPEERRIFRLLKSTMNDPLGSDNHISKNPQTSGLGIGLNMGSNSITNSTKRISITNVVDSKMVLGLLRAIETELEVVSSYPPLLVDINEILELVIMCLVDETFSRIDDLIKSKPKNGLFGEYINQTENISGRTGSNKVFELITKHLNLLIDIAAYLSRIGNGGIINSTKANNEMQNDIHVSLSQSSLGGKLESRVTNRSSTAPDFKFGDMITCILEKVNDMIGKIFKDASSIIISEMVKVFAKHLDTDCVASSMVTLTGKWVEKNKVNFLIQAISKIFGLLSTDIVKQSRSAAVAPVVIFFLKRIMSMFVGIGSVIFPLDEELILQLASFASQLEFECTQLFNSAMGLNDVITQSVQLDSNTKTLVITDYHLNPQSVLNILEVVNEIKKGQVSNTLKQTYKIENIGKPYLSIRAFRQLVFIPKESLLEILYNQPKVINTINGNGSNNDIIKNDMNGKETTVKYSKVVQNIQEKFGFIDDIEISVVVNHVIARAISIIYYLDDPLVAFLKKKENSRNKQEIRNRDYKAKLLEKLIDSYFKCDIEEVKYDIEDSLEYISGLPYHLINPNFEEFAKKKNLTTESIFNKAVVFDSHLSKKVTDSPVLFAASIVALLNSGGYEVVVSVSKFLKNRIRLFREVLSLVFDGVVELGKDEAIFEERSLWNSTRYPASINERKKESFDIDPHSDRETTALLNCMVVLGVSLASLSLVNAKDVGVTETLVDSKVSQLYRFKESNTYLALDNIEGVLLISDDSGKNWKKVDQIKEKNVYMYEHPFDRNTLFIIGQGKKHYLTKDSGAKWHEFEVPAKPSKTTQSPLSFNFAKVGHILYSGEKCLPSKSIFDSEICHTVYYYTMTGFMPSGSGKDSDIVKPLLSGNRSFTQCIWMKGSAEFQASTDDSIICIEDQNNNTENKKSRSVIGTRAVVSEDFFASESVVNFESGSSSSHFLLGITISKGFIILGTQKKDVRDMDIFVTIDGKEWSEGRLKLPFGVYEQSYTVLESTKYSLFVDVKFKGSTGTMYKSNSNGTYFTTSLDNTNRNSQGIVDIERINGIDGVLIANQFLDSSSGWSHNKGIIKSKISFDDGSTWKYINPPKEKLNKESYGCSEEAIKSGECSLHLHSLTSTRNPGNIFGDESAPGILLGVGSVGPRLLDWSDCDTFLSVDGGVSWKMIHEDAHMHETAGSGSIIVLVNDEGPTDSFVYSDDRGETWKSKKLPNKIRVNSVSNEITGSSPTILIVSTVPGSTNKKKTSLVSIDFDIWDRKCDVDPLNPKESSDIEIWTHETFDKTCVMGYRSKYARRKASARCTMPNKEPIQSIHQSCECARTDYECDYGFILNEQGDCILSGKRHIPKGACKSGETEYLASSGYRKIPGNLCTEKEGAKKLDEPVKVHCSEISDDTGYNVVHNHFDFDGIQEIFLFENSSSALVLAHGELYSSGDSGGTWKKVDLNSIIGQNNGVSSIVLNKFSTGAAYIITKNNLIYYTKDFGAKWTQLKNSPGISNGLRIQPLLSFHPSHPEYLLFAGGTECPNCYSIYYVSHDHGNSWKKLITHADKCVFSYTEEFKILDDSAVVCNVWHETEGKENSMDKLRFSPNKNYMEIVIIDSKNPHLIKRLDRGENGSVIDFFINSRYLVYSSEVDDLNDSGSKTRKIELRILSKGLSPVVPLFPPDMPVGLRPNGFTLLQSSSGSLLLDVEQASTNINNQIVSWGTLLVCNDAGDAFHVALEKTNRKSDGSVDVEKVEGIKGALIANQILNTEVLGRPGVYRQLQTMYSLDSGRNWHPLSAPKESNGSSPCVGCTLNLQGRTMVRALGGIYGIDSAPGSWVGVGNVGPYLDTNSKNYVYWSRDAGYTWEKVFNEPMHYEWGDYGGILLLVSQDIPTDTVHYTLDSGKTFHKYKFSDEKVVVKMLFNGYKSLGMQFLMVSITGTRKTRMIQLDFSGVNIPMCSGTESNDQLEKWDLKSHTSMEEKDGSGNSDKFCMFGESLSFYRRKKGVSCRLQQKGKSGDQPSDDNKKNIIETHVTSVCECSIADYDCDVGFWLNDSNECQLIGRDSKQPTNCPANTKYKGRSGYVKKIDNKCSGGKDYSEPVERICGTSKGIPTSSFLLPSEVEQLQYFTESDKVIARTKDNSVFISPDGGKNWKPLDFGNKIEAVSMNSFFKDIAVFFTNTDTHYITKDEAHNFINIKMPAPPSFENWPVLRFHPTNLDIMLYLGRPEGCSISDDSKSTKCLPIVYYTLDSGISWTKLHENVGKGGCVFIKSSDKGKSNIVTCATSLSTPNQLIKGSKVISSSNWFKDTPITLSSSSLDMAYTGEFLVIPEPSQFISGSMQLRISVDGKNTALAHFPGDRHDLSSAYTILDSDASFGSLVLHVTENNHLGAEWGTIYTSNSNGTYFRKALEHVNRNNVGLVDFERYAGLQTAIIANIVSNHRNIKSKRELSEHNFSSFKPRDNPANLFKTRSEQKNSLKELRTVLTVDGGSSWHYLRPPPKDANSKSYSCNPGKFEDGTCSLHLHGFSEVTDPHNIYSASGAIGVVMGLGNVGKKLDSLENSNLYLSRDGGFLWKEVKKGPHLYEFADHGAIIVTAKENTPVDTVEYTLDAGNTWITLDLDLSKNFKKGTNVIISMLTTEPMSSSRHLVALGKTQPNSSSGEKSKDVLINFDFTGAQPRVCVYDPLDEPKGKNSDDFELWGIEPNRGKAAFGSPSIAPSTCVLGVQTKYFRKIPTKDCYVGREFKQSPIQKENCPCSRADFECDFNFEPSSDGKCILIKGYKPVQTSCDAIVRKRKGVSEPVSYYNISSGYRLIPQSQCDRKKSNSLNIDKPIEVWCPNKAREIAMMWAFMLPLIFFGTAVCIFMLSSNPGMTVLDFGKLVIQSAFFGVIRIVDAIGRIGFFQEQYRHILPQNQNRFGNATDNEEMQYGDGNISGAAFMPSTGHRSPLSSVWESAKYSMYVSYGVLYDSVWEAALFGANYLPYNYRMYVHSMAPVGPIAFGGNEVLNLNNTTSHQGLSNTQVGSSEQIFELRDETDVDGSNANFNHQGNNSDTEDDGFLEYQEDPTQIFARDSFSSG